MNAATTNASNSERQSGERENYEFHNFCICFIDLLGQRAAMQGEGLLPVITTEEDRQRFIARAKQTIGSIARLQRRAEAMTTAKNSKRGQGFREKLTPEHQAIWDEMLRESWKRQRWSDGLVYFANLGANDTKCKINDVKIKMAHGRHIDEEREKWNEQY